MATRRLLTQWLDVYNKIDSISLEQVDKLAREDHTGECV